MDHCDNHIENCERLAALEALSNRFELDVEEIKTAQNEHLAEQRKLSDLMKDIKVCVEKNSVSHRYIVESIDMMKTDFKQHLKASEDIQKWGYDIADQIDQRLIEVEKFKWFRTWMTETRDNLPKMMLRYVIFGVLTIVFALIMLHWDSVGQILNSKLKSN